MSFAIRSGTTLGLIASLFTASGCQRSEPVQWEASQQVQNLAPALATQVSAAVQARSGTVLLPKMLTDAEPKSERDKFARELTLKHGQEVYMKRCVQCHGVSGDGNGPVAKNLYPRPRDYRRGIFKFTSTPYGGRPRREDLIATLDRGIIGTSMPEPQLTPERVALGREAFLSKGCSKCHGEDGRGHTKDNIGKDSWGHSTRAADLTSGMLHGGQDPIDIYRRIMNGINGSPMPGFKSSLESEPETIWNLVSYVLSVSNRRREGTAVPAGLMKPYAEPVEATAE